MKTSTKTFAAILLTAFALVALGASSAEPRLPAGPGQWLATGTSCTSGDICVEWCLTRGKQDIPTGVLCCLPEKLVGSTDFNACRTIRTD